MVLSEARSAAVRSGRDALGRHHRHAGVPAQHLDVRDGAEPSRHLADAARRQHEGIAAGEDHLPDARIAGDVGERGVERLAAERLRAAGADRLAAEAEAAVDRADVGELQQHAVGVAVHDAGGAGEAFVADRVGEFFGAMLQLAGVGHELAGDRIVRVGAIDQRGHGRRDGDGVAGGHRLQRDGIRRGHEARRLQLRH